MTEKREKLAEDIGNQAKRMKNAHDNPGPSPLRGFGTFGMVGWSIAVPTVGGAFIGLWLDKVAPQNFSWTVALILGGIVLGSLIAWAWIEKEGDSR